MFAAHLWHCATLPCGPKRGTLFAPHLRHLRYSSPVFFRYHAHTTRQLVHEAVSSNGGLVKCSSLSRHNRTQDPGGSIDHQRIKGSRDSPGMSIIRGSKARVTLQQRRNGPLNILVLTQPHLRVVACVMLEDKLDGKYDVILKILSHLDPILFVTIKEKVEVSKNGSELAQWLQRYTGATKLTKGKGLAQYLSPSIRETISGDRMLLRQGGVKARKGELAGDGMVSRTLKTGDVSRPLLPGDAYVKAALTATCQICDKTDTKYVGVIHGTVVRSGGAQRYEMNLFKNRITKDMLPSEKKLFKTKITQDMLPSLGGLPRRMLYGKLRVYTEIGPVAPSDTTLLEKCPGVLIFGSYIANNWARVERETRVKEAQDLLRKERLEKEIGVPARFFEVYLSIPSKDDCFLLLKEIEKRPDLAHYFRDALSAERVEGSKKNDETTGIFHSGLLRVGPDDPDADAESYMDAQDARFALERMLQKSIALQVENKVQRSFADFAKENESPGAQDPFIQERG